MRTALRGQTATWRLETAVRALLQAPEDSEGPTARIRGKFRLLGVSVGGPTALVIGIGWSLEEGGEDLSRIKATMGKPVATWNVEDGGGKRRVLRS